MQDNLGEVFLQLVTVDHSLFSVGLYSSNLLNMMVALATFRDSVQLFEPKIKSSTRSIFLDDESSISNWTYSNGTNGENHHLTFSED